MAGAKPLAGAQRRAVPRIQDKVHERVRLLRLLVRPQKDSNKTGPYGYIYCFVGVAVRVLVGSMAGGYLNAPSRVWSSTCGAHTLDCPGHVPLSQGHGRFAKCGSSRSQKRASCDLMTRTTLCVLDTNIPSASHERVAYDFRKRVRRACRSTTSFWCAAPTPREHRGQECMKFCTGHATIAHFATVPSSGTGLR